MSDRTNILPAETNDPEAVIGMIIMGGPLSGAMVRDIRLANELARRGYKVHVWWAMDKVKPTPLDDRIGQHWLFHAARYYTNKYNRMLNRNVKEKIGLQIHRMYSNRKSAHSIQKRPHIMDGILTGMQRMVCEGMENDPENIKRFARELTENKVTHVLPMLSVLCPWIAEARKHVPHQVKYLVTFQGYELYSNYARIHGFVDELYQRLNETVSASDYPAIAVSGDYRLRVQEDIGVPLKEMVAIPPGIPKPTPLDRPKALDRIKRGFLHSFREGIPLIAFVGRRDSEKGIDLLLYAAKLLQQRNVDFQLAICGPTLFGNHYREICIEIAENLRCPVLWKKFISDELRQALFAGSDCVVYPSIHREPFGMVPVEAMAHGTPAVVPDQGGVASVIEANGNTGGIRFKAWDSGDLADQLERVLQDRELWQKLSDGAPKVADYFSVENLGSRVLSHIGLPKSTGQGKPGKNAVVKEPAHPTQINANSDGKPLQQNLNV